jgi:DNA-binding CsgD family transcriptional regulator/tetratricopeptide (TPR) repeat protein
MTQPAEPLALAHVATRPPAPLLERVADLAALCAHLDAARDGNGRLALVEGSAGIGKTRLLGEVRANAERMGMRVLSARGGELEHEFAFGIVRQLFEPLLAMGSADQRAELLAGAASLAAPLFGESALEETAGDVSFSILHGLYWVAANAALSQPTALIVDDLHWSDAPSLRWLAYAARRLEGLPLILILGTRPPEQIDQGALVAELLMDPAATVLKPSSLTVESVRILAREVFGAEPEDEFCVACRDATAGNPLYLWALLITLAGDGIAPVAASAARVRDVGPEPVARAVSLRLSRLSQDAVALADAVAVLGQGANLSIAAELAGIDRGSAIAASTALVRTELLRLEPAVEFAHPVVRAAIYEAIGPIERGEAHRRAAGLLAERGAEPEQSACHLLLVPPAADAFVVPVLRDAAGRALARGAPDVAVTYLRRALAEPPAQAEWADLLWELGAAERGVDLPACLEHLRDAVALIDDPARHAEVALDYGRAEMYANLDHPGLVRTFQQAIDGLGTGNRGLRELLEAELLNGALGGDANVYQTALTLISAIDDRDLSGGFGSDLLLAGLAHYEVRRGADRARTIAVAQRSAASGLVERTVGHALYYPPHALGAAGETAAAMGYYERAIDHARRGGDQLSLSGLLGFRGALATEQGDLVAAEQDLREGIELAKGSGVAGNVMYLAAWLTDFLIERGSLEEGEATIADLGLPEQVPEILHFIFFLYARGTLRLAQRKPDTALNDFVAIGRIAEPVDIHNPAFRPWRSGAALALHALGREDEARELAAEELELARRWGAPRTVGVSLRTLGLVDRPSRREARLREAIDVLAASPARLEHARALVDLGAALRRRNERSQARELLREGVHLAVRSGAIPLVERANEELAATGARPRTLVLSGLDSLTASERRVAQLAAEELSNKEIAQALFVTVKTVEVHLSHVYRKLDIGSRRQLSAAFAAPVTEPVGAP